MSIKSVIASVRALHQRKYRDQEGAFLVQGPKLVEDLLATDFIIREIHATEEAAQRSNDARTQVWPDHVLERMGTLESGNQVIAVVERPKVGVIDRLDADEFVIALDGIADPGNLGTILRIADWFGVKRIVCSADAVDEFNPKCVQASMGSIFRVAVHRGDLPKELGRLRAEGARLDLASMEGESVFNVPLPRPAILILGSESHGPSDAVRALKPRMISVPRYGAAESLNVAMAASALCMEYSRRSD
ncbi:MAG: RNA methyltransferase [Flavobacteriales bacterium]|nr:RNA methyltransferase [Flavobacteriales bacterium]